MRASEVLGSSVARTETGSVEPSLLATTRCELVGIGTA